MGREHLTRGAPTGRKIETSHFAVFPYASVKK